MHSLHTTTPLRALVLIPLLASCARTSVGAPRDVQPGADFELRPAETARLPDALGQVTLLGVADSRCPSDVQCITAGDAVVRVRLDGPGSSRTDTLHTDPPRRTVDYGAHRLELVDVRPYPRTSSRDSVRVVVLRLARIR